MSPNEPFKWSAFFSIFESEHDPLTKLFNRRAGKQLLNIMIADANKNNNQLALLLIDLNGFKQINDNHGHDVGDKVLIEVSNRMQATMRKEDVLIRLGGDEFIIAIIPKVGNPNEVNHVIDKLLEQLSNGVIMQNNLVISMGESIGIASFPQDEKDIETLMASADTAMYQAKNSGKNCASFFRNE